jgi:photosystem II stability/assembly factor-like uncharacterized protein
MKKIFLSLIAIAPLIVHGQWNQIPQGLWPVGLLGVAGERNIVLAHSGNTGTAKHISYSHQSGDPSTSWRYTETEFESEFFYDIDFVNDSVGFLCGGGWFTPNRNILLKTINAGASWETIRSDGFNEGFMIQSMDFINHDAGMIFKYDNADNFQKTIDGGNTWQTMLLETGTEDISEICLLNDTVGFVAIKSDSAQSIKSKIYKTTDFGLSWKKVYELSNFHNIYKIQFLDSVNGFACGDNGTFLSTNDGGTTWEIQHLFPYNSLTAMWFMNLLEGYINLNGTIHKTTNGGKTWSPQIMNPVNIVSSIQFTPSGNSGYLLAGGMLYQTTNGGGPTTIAIPELNSKLKIYPNPANTFIRIEYEEDLEIYSIQLINVLGATIKSFHPNDTQLDLFNITKGIYFIQLYTNEGFINEKISIL